MDRKTQPPFIAACAICAKTCEPGERLSVVLPLVDYGAQNFFVHWHCLRRVLDESIPLLDAPDYQQDPQSRPWWKFW
jgi:hypothetical protein